VALGQVSKLQQLDKIGLDSLSQNKDLAVAH
jgi:hypothetical protein